MGLMARTRIGIPEKTRWKSEKMADKLAVFH